MSDQLLNTEINVKACAPSNIAIVKYWGKQGIQEPVNPSISFTLTKAVTHTVIKYKNTKIPLNLQFLFDGKVKEAFLPKLQTLTTRVSEYLPFIKEGDLTIESTNTFPHSSGIASSASSMASIAMGLVDIQNQITPTLTSVQNTNLSSQLARLGSGSACRSTQKGWVLWGKTPENESSSNEYGISINKNIHPYFNELQDSILIIRQGTKAVSSTIGHQLMDKHPYKEGRIQQANNNIIKLLKALQKGDFTAFSEVCEEEAMSLHSLMMSSTPSYTLLAPESLRAINRIKKFREKYHIPLTFTLDAGPNIHLIYPKNQNKIVVPFIAEYLKPLCENEQVIDDYISVD